MSTRIITREEFEEAMETLWTEIEYQNRLTRRTEDEAKDVAGFATLGRRYQTLLEQDWADNPGVEKALHSLRKLAGIYVRGMIYCGLRPREFKTDHIAINPQAPYDDQ